MRTLSHQERHSAVHKRDRWSSLCELNDVDFWLEGPADLGCCHALQGLPRNPSVKTPLDERRYVPLSSV